MMMMLVLKPFIERSLQSKRTLYERRECEWMRECECVYVRGGGDNSVYGGKLVLLFGVCEQRLLLAGHQCSLLTHLNNSASLQV